MRIAYLHAIRGCPELSLGAHVEGGFTNFGGGVSGNLQPGVLIGAEDVSEAQGLGYIGAVDIDIWGGIAITVAATPDLKIWSVSFGPGAGADASAKFGWIKYTPIWKPIRTFQKLFKKDKNGRQRSF